LNLIEQQLINNLLKSSPVLEGLEDLLIRALNTSAGQAQQKSLGDCPGEDLGVITNLGLLKNIRKARKFVIPSALYGHRYGKSVLARWDVGKSNPIDVYCTDDNKLLKNHFDDEGSAERLTRAMKIGQPIFMFFGGSTMMSMGAETPDFSIPALTEYILRAKYRKDTVCINYGLGGTCSSEALSLYVHQARESTKNANVVFYDGWNCALYLTLAQFVLSSEKPSTQSLLSNGETLRHLEHNITLSKVFDVGWHLSQLVKLSLSWVSGLFVFGNESKLNRALFWLHHRILRLGTSRNVDEIINQIKRSDDTIELAAKAAVIRYVHLHECVNAICEKSDARFLWIQQPLVFWGDKPLTTNEKKWKEEATSSGDPRIYEMFERHFRVLFKSKPENDLLRNFCDFTTVFDAVEAEVYYDTGHLNRLGNVVVAASIAKEIFQHGTLPRNKQVD